MPKIFAIVPAAGVGTRFVSDLPKQFLRFDGESSIERVLDVFVSVPEIDAVCCVVPDGFVSRCEAIFEKYGERVLPAVVGGKTRQESVRRGLEAIARFSPDFVLVHDAARPNVTSRLICDVVGSLKNGEKAVVPGIGSPDSVRILGKSVSREDVRLIQTPQGFEFQTLFGLHQKYKNLELSDDASLFDLENITIKIIQGDSENFKITFRSDIKNQKIKTGFGFDVHAFADDRKLFLMGVEIEGHRGLCGVSDADVGIHSLVDAIFGALGCGSIGEHFPPSDEKFKNCDSKKFLDYCKKLLAENNSEIVNCDVTIVCESPNISQYVKEMKRVTAGRLGINPADINIKGKTTEGLGFVGRRDGIVSYSIVTLRCFYC